MSSLWPWLAVAGVGALHGLNPATGWALAATWGVRSRDPARAWRALASIAAGHGLSVGLVAAVVALGMSTDRLVLQAVAGVLLLVAVAVHLSGRRPAGHAALALCSFMMSTAHGAGLMLVPALIPLCVADTPGREITASGSLALALAAVGVHTAAMLAVSGLAASIACGAALRLAQHFSYFQLRALPSASHATACSMRRKRVASALASLTQSTYSRLKLVLPALKVASAALFFFSAAQK